MNQEVEMNIEDSSPALMKNTLFAGVSNIPHPNKAYKGGEDSFVVTNNLVAVADGVGGWNKKDIDPGLFSSELCKHVRNAFLDKSKSQEISSIKLKPLLDSCVEQT